MRPANIRIPTRNAPAAHHLTFLCAVAELTHRVLESVTGLRLALEVKVYDHINMQRQPELSAAADAAGLPYCESNGTAWHTWGPDRIAGPRVVVFGEPKPTSAPMRRCYSKSACEADCPYRDNCLDGEPAVTIEPENNTELGQVVTTALEAEARWTAEDILRPEG